MKELKLGAGKRALVIVAHPDDETIWMGGTIMRYKNLEWTILSLCRSSDQDREPKFKRVCERFGARAIITDLDDEDKLSLKETIPIIKKLISEQVGNESFDYLFIHGKNGEYGHERHIGVHRAVKELIKENKLKVEKVLCFHYQKAPEGELPLITQGKEPDYILNLSETKFIEKKQIVSEIYGYDPKGIDVGYSTNPEAFKTLK